MFKLLIVSSIVARDAPSVHSVIAEFETKDQADRAYDKMVESANPQSWISNKVVKLY